MLPAHPRQVPVITPRSSLLVQSLRCRLVLRLRYLFLSILLLPSACGGGGGSSSSAPPPATPFTAQLSANSSTVYQRSSSNAVTITVNRTASTGSVTATILNAPAGLTATIQSPANTTSGSVTVAAGTATPGTYSLTVHLTDASNTADLPLAVTVGALTSIAPTVGTHFDEVMSTSFQIAEWSDPSFVASFPLASAPLSALQPNHIRLQPLSHATPQSSATTWDFTLLDRQVQPLLTIADRSPEFQIATAPTFMYVPGTQTFADPTFATFANYSANLVRYYNTGGFNAPDGHHQSPAAAPIQWWGIHNEPNINGLSPTEYVQLYNATVPAMLAADPTLRFAAVELADFTNEEQRYLPTFVQNVNARVDVLATHVYSSCNQRDTDTQLFTTVPGFASEVRNIYSLLQTKPALASVPVWVTENNVNADFDKGNGQSACNAGQTFVTDQRGSSAFFAAWRPYVFSQLGKAGNHALYHWS